MSADESTALTLAAMRITAGNPTAEEVAAIAVLLTARLRLLHEHEQQEQQDTRASVHRLPPRAPRMTPYTAPRSWAS
ncbi:acyl-CoA carboxylase epsilon subunit [Streptomyces sp. NPDC012888]|uniref:acyl-CoA carboxylase epsilon subunit n=1 Tax=Streptomyces sp. NPDC012888 TaxID=3364855 RepID=UPI0036747019